LYLLCRGVFRLRQECLLHHPAALVPLAHPLPRSTALPALLLLLLHIQSTALLPLLVEVVVVVVIGLDPHKTTSTTSPSPLLPVRLLVPLPTLPPVMTGHVLLPPKHLEEGLLPLSLHLEDHHPLMGNLVDLLPLSHLIPVEGLHYHHPPHHHQAVVVTLPLILLPIPPTSSLTPLMALMVVPPLMEDIILTLPIPTIPTTTLMEQETLMGEAMTLTLPAVAIQEEVEGMVVLPLLLPLLLPLHHHPMAHSNPQVPGIPCDDESQWKSAHL